MAQKFDLFNHSHDHDHDHGHDHDHHGRDPNKEDLDPAQRSLAEALRVSFRLLQGVMVVLAIIYLFSGIFSVGAGETVVKLSFGEIAGPGGGQVIPQGGPHFALPYPLHQIVRIPTASRQVNIDKAFWYEVTEADQGKTRDEIAAGKTGPLNPEKDGSLLTGDANIIHARWSIVYTIDDPIDFIKNVGDPSSEERMIASAERIIRAAAQRAIIHYVAGMEADAVNKGLTGDDYGRVRSTIQESLDRLSSGIAISSVSAEQAFPNPVRDAFAATTSAETERLQLIEQAKQEWNKVLGEVAGEAYIALWDLVQDYQEALETDSGDTARLAELESQMDEAFRTLNVETSGDAVVAEIPIGGKVAEKINEARTYRTSVVQSVKAEAASFNLLLDHWRSTPRIVENRLWQDVRQAILGSSTNETIYLPAGGQVYLEMNRDPAVRKEIERTLLEEARAAEQAGGNG